MESHWLAVMRGAFRGATTEKPRARFPGASTDEWTTKAQRAPRWLDFGRSLRKTQMNFQQALEVVATRRMPAFLDEDAKIQRFAARSA